MVLKGVFRNLHTLFYTVNLSIEKDSFDITPKSIFDIFESVFMECELELLIKRFGNLLVGLILKHYRYLN